MPLVADELLWLHLAEIPGVGTRAAHRLLHEFGSPAAIFAANESSLTRVVDARLARNLRADPDAAVLATLERTRAWLASSSQHHLLTWADPRFPRALLELADAPVVLHAIGRTDLLARQPAVAVVGSRHATAGGLDDAHAFAESLARHGVTIVSGLAAGIDGAAHRGALAAGATGGGTIAVVGTGLDRVYPAAHRDLAHAIAEAGVLISEYPLGTPPRTENFPRRNRVIAGLVRGVLVVEASLRSGSLITARLAAEQGRDVYAMPGSIHSPHHKGCHALIKQGAKLVESAADVLEELGVPIAQSQPGVESAPAGASQVETHGWGDVLGDALGFDPIDVDSIALRSGLSGGEVIAALTLLELERRAECLADGRWQRRKAPR